MSEATCVIGHAEPRRADVGYLCVGHFDNLGRLLRTIEDEAALLDTRPSFQQRNGNRGASLASHRSPAIIDAVVATDPRQGRPPKDADRYDPWAFDDTASVLETLHGWARVVREERQLTTPETVTISRERDMLTRNLDWIAAQPWVDECYRELRDLAAQLQRTNKTGADKPYSRCPVLVNGQHCAGDVWVHDEMQPVWRRYPDRCAMTWEQAPGAAVCDMCGATWATDADKARLRRMVEDAAAEAERPKTADGRPMFTAEELVAHGVVSTVSNVRVRALRRGVASVRGHYDPDALRGVS